MEGIEPAEEVIRARATGAGYGQVARGLHWLVVGLLVLQYAIDSPLGRAMGDIHTATAWVLLAVAGLHVTAALYHHFLLRDGVLRRMLP